MTQLEIDARGARVAQEWQDAEARRCVALARRDRTLLGIAIVFVVHALPLVLALVLTGCKTYKHEILPGKEAEYRAFYRECMAHVEYSGSCNWRAEDLGLVRRVAK